MLAIIVELVLNIYSAFLGDITRVQRYGADCYLAIIVYFDDLFYNCGLTLIAARVQSSGRIGTVHSTQIPIGHSTE